MSHAFILAGSRTPIGKFLGSLSTVEAPKLGAVAIAEALRRASIAREQVDEVIMGNVLSAGLGQAPARQAALAAGLPPTVSALTVNMVCGSGLRAVMLADQAIRSGDARVIVAGGMENMSRAPYVLKNAREGWKFGNQQVLDTMLHDGLWCACEQTSMGAAADYIAHEHGIGREAQDRFAVESHRRAAQAIAEKAFAAEIVPVSVPGRKGDTIVEHDEGPRSDTSLAALAVLRPSFEDRGLIRSVTAGNASQISDGAAAVVLADEATAASVSSPFKARIVAAASSGVAPKDIFIAPVSAVERVLAKAKLKLGDIDLFEMNEAFAAQCLACGQKLGLDLARTNVHGGAIALGHPIGASGARVLVTLLYTLHDRRLKRGLAALCLGGGNAVAMIVELV